MLLVLCSTFWAQFVCQSTRAVTSGTFSIHLRLELTVVEWVVNSCGRTPCEFGITVPLNFCMSEVHEGGCGIPLK